MTDRSLTVTLLARFENGKYRTTFTTSLLPQDNSTQFKVPPPYKQAIQRESNNSTKMLSRSALRASPTLQLVARRGFSSTRSQMSSPYHYPEGPRSNIPFNPLTKFFAVRYWSFMAVGFGAFCYAISIGEIVLTIEQLPPSLLLSGRPRRTSKLGTKRKDACGSGFGDCRIEGINRNSNGVYTNLKLRLLARFLIVA